MSELAHVVRTQHFDTGQIEMMCGETRDKWEDPERASALCGGCAVEVVNLIKHRLDEAQGVSAQTRRVVMRELIAQESTVEDLTERLRKVEKKVRKSEKDKG